MFANILLLGSGAREHALAKKLADGRQTRQLFCAPGNPGMAEVSEILDLDITDNAAVVAAARKHRIDLVVVGPEGPLCNGVVDALEAAGIAAFGPGRAAARLEGSKGFTKDLCRDNGIPTADYLRFDDLEEAKRHVRRRGAPIVVKADGLAAGKGVTVSMSVDAAEKALDGIFSKPGAEVVIEEFLEGEECSFFVLCDGVTAVPFGSAQDHKRAFDGDTGPNTGGMGAYSPASIMTKSMTTLVMDDIIGPTLRAMDRMGCPFKGVLFAGLMITKNGPKLIEYNVRFGDPECQVLMMRLASPLLPALLACAGGTLDRIGVHWRDEAAIAVVMAANGYPDGYEKGSEIRGVAHACDLAGVEVFHAGTSRAADGRLLANGGRVLNVAARGITVGQAAARAYAGISRIDWPGGFFRRDIGKAAIGLEIAETV